MDILCYLCKINYATQRLSYLKSEAKMCVKCDNFLGDNFIELFDIQLDYYEFYPLTILRNVPANKKNMRLKR